MTQVGSKEVPWFPTSISDFNHIGKRILGEGDGIQDADHPGFRDPVYRERREFVAQFLIVLLDAVEFKKPLLVSFGGVLKHHKLS